jgi:hypothetical protein
MFQGKRLYGFGQTKRFEPIDRFRDIVLDIAKPAISGTFIAQNHETCGSSAPTFAFIGAVSTGAYGI